MRILHFSAAPTAIELATLTCTKTTVKAEGNAARATGHLDSMDQRYRSELPVPVSRRLPPRRGTLASRHVALDKAAVAGLTRRRDPSTPAAREAVLLRPTGIEAPYRVVVMWPTSDGNVGDFPFAAAQTLSDHMRSIHDVSRCERIRCGHLHSPA